MSKKSKHLRHRIQVQWERERQDKTEKKIEVAFAPLKKAVLKGLS